MASLQSCYFAAAAQAQEREIEREKRAGKREIEEKRGGKEKEEGLFPSCPDQTRERYSEERERELELERESWS
jgi:hypothetical protein